MFVKLQKKLMNVYLFADLFRMKIHLRDYFTEGVDLQQKRLHRLVRKAYQIPFYRERFDKAGVRPEDIVTGDDLAKLPVLTKDELREWMASEIEKPKYRDYIVDTTSGSTGKPLSIMMSPREKAYMKANWLRVMLVAGYNPFTGKTMSRINAHDENVGSRDTFLQRLGILRRAYLDQYAPEEEMIRQINAYRPDFLYLNKSELMRLVLYCKRTGTRVWHPRFYDPISEKVTENDRRLFKEVLGPGLIDAYGSAETGSCLLRLRGKKNYIIHYDSFVVNVIDDEGNLADEGRLVITPLYKTDLPLINYQIGDSAVCAEKNGLRYVKDIKGRLNDYFYYENGEVTSFFEVTPVIAHCSDILQIRFIEETYDLIHVQIVRDENAKMSREEIETYVSSNLNKIFKKPFEFEFEWLDAIPPDPNGKLRMIVSKVKPGA